MRRARDVDVEPAAGRDEHAAPVDGEMALADVDAVARDDDEIFLVPCAVDHFELLHVEIAVRAGVDDAVALVGTRACHVCGMRICLSPVTGMRTPLTVIG